MNGMALIKSRAAFVADAHRPVAVSDPVAAKLNGAEAFSRLSRSAQLVEHASYEEVRRITSMPLVFTMDDAEQEAFNRMHILAEAFDAGFRLFPPQAEALAEYQAQAGGFFPVGVGWGKTLITLMVANAAWQKGIKKILLFVPSQVLIQLVTVDVKMARSHVPITYPIHILGGRAMNVRRAMARSNKKGLYILPYSCLSTKDTHEVLEAISPELIIADEAHNLSRRSAARTRRVLDYIDKRRPELVALSGTITSKSVMDYYHLIRHCLRSTNPLPNSSTMAREWAAIIDAQATSDGQIETHAHTGPLLPLIQWARKWFPAIEFTDDVPSFRRAYKLRLNTAPGVVASGDSEIGTSLTMANEAVVNKEQSPGWGELKTLIDQVETQWLTPNGDEIEHAIHTWKWLFELSAGFYNEMTWPTTEVFAARRSISEDQADDVLERANAYHAAGQVYASELRSWLETKSRPGLDTPLLVGHDMSRHGDENVGDLYGFWKDWRDADFEGRPDRDARAVRVSPYKIDAAVQWASEHHRGNQGKGAIMWVWHQEIGLWLSESLSAAGLPVLHCPAGDAYNASILDHKNVDKIVVASIMAHGTGKNLQHFEHQYFMQWPRSPVAAEQTLGRTHRNGQKADELVVHQNLTLDFDCLNFAACLNDALYIHQTTGNRQKLIYANYSPLPKVFPPAVLHERGLQNKMLSAEQRAMLEAKFGDGRL